MSKGDISFYVDTLIVETVLGDPSLVKNAQAGGILSGIYPMIQEYVHSKIDENDKVGSVINMLAPAVITELFSAFGLTKIGWLLGIAASMMHINVAGIVEKLWSEVKGTLSSGQKVVPSQIDNAVSSAVQEQTSPEQEVSQADDTVVADLQEARMLRLALEQYEYQLLSLTKENAPVLTSYAIAGRGARTTNVLGRIIGWIFKVVLMSAGLMLTGDVANKMLGRPNSLTGNFQAGKTLPTTSAPAAPVSTQTKFKVNSSYQPETPPRPWEVNISNDPSSIENMLVQFTKDVYSGLDGKEGIIRMSPTFQGVKDQIAWYNHAAAGEPMIYIPPNYANKKAIVDHYIDEVSRSV